MTRIINSHFLDSGAFTQKTQGIKYHEKHGGDRWAFFDTDDFKGYVDDYARFLKRYGSTIDLYANIDVIHNPQRTWDNQKYMEEYHGLHPMPVVHSFTDLKWLVRYIEAGYDYIGFGGKPMRAVPADYMKWLDRCFGLVCSTPNHLPVVKIHGFGAAWIRLWLKYPYYSIDSTSIHKNAGYGWIFMPFLQGDKYKYMTKYRLPRRLGVTRESPRAPIDGTRMNHLAQLKPPELENVKRWLKLIGVPLGDDNTPGVTNDFYMRRVAIYRFYELAVAAMDPWPRPYDPKIARGLYEDKCTWDASPFDGTKEPGLHIYHAGCDTISKIEARYFTGANVMTTFHGCRKRDRKGNVTLKPNKTMYIIRRERNNGQTVQRGKGTK